MKIGIDIRSTLKRPTGIGRYTFNLIKGLAAVDSQNNYYLYSRKKILDLKRHLPKLPAANFTHCVDYFKKGHEVTLPDVDCFFTPSYDLQRPKEARFIVTIHDVTRAHPYGHTERTIEEIDRKVRRVLSAADSLVADSYSTKSDLMEYYGMPDSKITVIYPGIEIGAETVPGLQARADYILFVGTLEPRKNVNGLIRAFTWLKKEFHIRHKLYITGMKGWMFDGIFKEYERSEFKKDIVFKGYVKDRDLMKLYKEASLFVYPSFYEGFGYPIIEAFNAGTPVVTSKTSSCGEIAGDSALLIDPSNYKEIGGAILRLINDGGLRRKLALKGLNRAGDFTLEKTAKKFVELFTH